MAAARCRARAETPNQRYDEAGPKGLLPPAKEDGNGRRSQPVSGNGIIHHLGNVMAEGVAGGDDLEVLLLSRARAKQLRLKAGDPDAVIVKSTAVMVDR
jgi:hypothetical protein